MDVNSVDDQRADIEDMDDVEFENIRNIEDMDDESIYDDINTDKLLEAMEVDFEDMVEDMVEDDIECECHASVSDSNADRAEKFVQSSKIRALALRTRHCVISCYYTEWNNVPIYCARCMIELWNIADKGMYIVRNHKECSFYILDSRWTCHECGQKVHTVYPCSMCPLCANMDGVNTDDTECLVQLSDGNMDHAEKFVQSAEIKALNIRTEHCLIHCYYTPSGDDNDVAICTRCMISPRNYKYGKNSLRKSSSEGMHLIRMHQGETFMRKIGVEGMYRVRKHQVCSFSSRKQYIDCLICEEPTYTVFPRSMCPLCTH